MRSTLPVLLCLYVEISVLVNELRVAAELGQSQGVRVRIQPPFVGQPVAAVVW